MLIHSQVCVVELIRQGNSAAFEKITEAQRVSQMGYLLE